MPTPLKKHDAFEHDDSYQESQGKFQDFQEFNGQSAKLKELVFFAWIACFSLITVLFAFVLLVMNLAPVLAFLFASIISLGITSLLAKGIKSLLM
ncbi:DUF3270 domain-containing protein [Streptococcus dysgalactiae]|uniref:DUF3270 domain-containing protein n=1 Tax=Streptococcus dysgalactiae TaxID=1334 RepID=UPI0024B6ED03|nr:DUF3270 domain-containing protein [Streptococcus dysgalactiae]